MRKLAEIYCECRLLADGSVDQVAVAVGHWDRFFRGRSVEGLCSLDYVRFSAHLRQSLGPATANKTRAHLLAVLRWGASVGLIDCDPAWEAWKKSKEPRKAPLAFTQEEFRDVLSAAKAWPGWICGVSASDWWESLLLSIWYSGARIGAVLAVQWKDVLFDRPGFYVRAEHQKQFADQFFVVGEDCLAALERARQPEREVVWPWPHRREALYRRFRKILSLAGVQAPAGAGSLFHRIRRSTASYVRAAGGDATAQLGHSCSSVTQRYYDPRICGAHDSTAAMPSLG